MAKKGKKGGNASGGAAVKSKSAGSKAPSKEKGSAYQNETRKIILSVNKLRKVILSFPWCLTKLCNFIDTVVKPYVFLGDANREGNFKKY